MKYIADLVTLLDQIVSDETILVADYLTNPEEHGGCGSHPLIEEASSLATDLLINNDGDDFEWGMHKYLAKSGYPVLCGEKVHGWLTGEIITSKGKIVYW